MKQFRRGLPLLITIILVVSFVGVSVLNYLVTKGAVREEILRQDLPLTMDNIYSELLAMLTKPLLVSSSMAADTFLIDWVIDGEQDIGKIIKYLGQIQGKYDFFTSFFVSAKTYNYYRYSGLHKTLSPTDSHDVWFYDFVASNREYDLDVDSDEGANNLLTIFINQRVEDPEGELLGVAGVGLQVKSVAKKIGEYKQKYDRVVYLTDTQGTIQVHPDTSFIETKRIQDMAGFSLYADEILADKAGHASYGFDRDGQQILVTVRYIPSLQWFLFVEQSMAHKLTAARKNLFATLAVGAVVSVLVIVLTAVTVNRYQRRIEALVVTDELTGANNRRALEIEFERAKYDFLRHNRPFCLMTFDLDHYKQVNDMLGHGVGDEYLRTLVTMLTAIIRPTDTLARWGGDEFVLLFPGSLAESIIIAERIRAAVAGDRPGGKEKAGDPRNSVTLSSGITMFMQHDSLSSMMQRVDGAMYTSKRQGGNMVTSI